MKRKSIFLLGTILAGVALVGGTFAAWAVTDKADPFSVNITPGTLDVGTNKGVTLEWGTKGLVNIENLEMGVEKGPYEVGLKATTTDLSDFTGSLSAALTTTYEGTGEKLLNHLKVDVYHDISHHGEQNDPAEPVLTIESGEYTTGENPQPIPKSVAVDIPVTSGTEYKVYFYITLDAGINPVTYNAMKEQVVSLTIDWNKGSTIDVVTSQTIYFNNTGNWENVKVYAWNSTTGASNAEWPGLAMTQVKGSIYTLAVETTFDKIQFNNAVNKETTGAIEWESTIPAITANTPYYDGGTWKGAPDVSAETVYYFVGAGNDWVPSEAHKFVKLGEAVEKGGHNYGYKLASVPVVAGYDGRFKAISSDNMWYGTASGADMQVSTNGVYDIYFDPEAKDTANCLYAELKPVTYDTYVLDLGTGDGTWAQDNPAVFVYSWGTVARAEKLADNAVLKVPQDATTFILVRMKAGTTEFAWSGENFYNQSVDLTREDNKDTLTFTGWGDSNNDNKSTFTWSASV